MIYFISDAHLGSRVVKNGREHEQKVVAWLDSVKRDATAIYMLGDMFDFWFEYRMTVPKGYVRFLGKMAELVDSGIEIHFFTGNHDIWTFGYLEKEIGVKVHQRGERLKIGNRWFYLAHGDLEHDESRTFRMMNALFHSRLAQALFSLVPSAWAQEAGYRWSKHNRIREVESENAFRGEDNENIVMFSKKYATEHPETDFFVFGHRHILVDLPISDCYQGIAVSVPPERDKLRNDANRRVIILGDFVSLFTYGKFDGEQFTLEHFSL
jgi:UDP-2,3-diacylglucosamine hydrolase